MPSDVFWTGLFTFGGSVAGAGAGYLTALFQRQANERLLLFEERKLAGLAQERRDEHGDRIREERRAVYLAYLTALDGVLTPIDLGSVEEETLRRRFDRLMEAHCELELAGDRQINECGYALNDLVEGLVAEVLDVLRRSLGAEEAMNAVARRASEIRKTRRRLIGFMSAHADERAELAGGRAQSS